MKKLFFCLLLFASPAFAQQPVTTTVHVTWDEATAGATFNVYRWDKTQTSGFKKINAAPITAMSYDDPTAVVGVTYSYRVTAVNAGGESAQSLEKVISVSAPIVIPLVPTNVKVTVVITN
jgi:fibronectin type 3 domain-containing protein